MSLKPIPVRANVPGDQERYDRDVADMKVRPWAWGINPGVIRQQQIQAAGKAAMDAEIKRLTEESIAKTTAEILHPLNPPAPVAETSSVSEEQAVRRGPGRPKREVTDAR